jgi:hypothetical protein
MPSLTMPRLWHWCLRLPTPSAVRERWARLPMADQSPTALPIRGAVGSAAAADLRLQTGERGALVAIWASLLRAAALLAGQPLHSFHALAHLSVGPEHIDWVVTLRVSGATICRAVEPAHHQKECLLSDKAGRLSSSSGHVSALVTHDAGSAVPIDRGTAANDESKRSSLGRPRRPSDRWIVGPLHVLRVYWQTPTNEPPPDPPPSADHSPTDGARNMPRLIRTSGAGTNVHVSGQTAEASPPPEIIILPSTPHHS